MLRVHIPELLRSLSRQRSFWNAFHFIRPIDLDSPRYVALAPLDDDPVLISFPTGHRLCIYACAQGVFASLEVPGEVEQKDLGWRDSAHPVPCCLRWPEVDLLGRAVALSDPTLAHPGLMVAILATLAPITDEHDADYAFPLLEQAFRSLIGLDDRAFSKLVALFDRRDAKYRWQQVACGWAISQSDDDWRMTGIPLHAGRSEKEESFPHRDVNTVFENLAQTVSSSLSGSWWGSHGDEVRRLATQIVETRDRQLMTALHSTMVESDCPHQALIDACTRDNDANQVWVLETLLSLEPGSLFRSWFGPTRHTWAETRRVDFELPALPGHETPAEIVRVLNRRLLEKRAGGASVVGNGRHDGVAWATVSVSLTGAFDPSFARLIRLLRALRAPEETRLSWCDPELRRATLREVIAAVS